MGKLLVRVENGRGQENQPRFCRKVIAICSEVPELQAVIRDKCWGMDISFSREEVRPGPVTVRIVMPCGIELPPDQSSKLAERLGESLQRFYPEQGYDPRQIKVSIFHAPQLLAVKSPEELLGKLQPEVDGVILRVGGKQVTFLPEKWWDFPELKVFMSELAADADLNPQAWQQPDAKVLVFKLQAAHTTKASG